MVYYQTKYHLIVKNKLFYLDAVYGECGPTLVRIDDYEKICFWNAYFRFNLLQKIKSSNPPKHINRILPIHHPLIASSLLTTKQSLIVQETIAENLSLGRIVFDVFFAKM